MIDLHRNLFDESSIGRDRFIDRLEVQLDRFTNIVPGHLQRVPLEEVGPQQSA